MVELSRFMNEINWLVSLLVAIPLSVAGNLLTPYVQNWWAGKSNKTARARLLVVEREFTQASRFAKDRSTLNSYLLISVITIVVLFALTNVLMGLVSTLMLTPIPVEMVEYVRLAIPITSLLTALLNIMAVVRATQAATVYRRVENFAQYESETNALLAKLRSNAA